MEHNVYPEQCPCPRRAFSQLYNRINEIYRKAGSLEETSLEETSLEETSLNRTIKALFSQKKYKKNI